MRNGHRQRRYREYESHHRPRKSDVKKRLAICDYRTDSDKRAHRAEQRRKWNEIWIAGRHAVITTGKKMPQLVRQQNSHQSKCKGKPRQQDGGISQRQEINVKEIVERRYLAASISQ